MTTFIEDLLIANGFVRTPGTNSWSFGHPANTATLEDFLDEVHAEIARRATRGDARPDTHGIPGHALFGHAAAQEFSDRCTEAKIKELVHEAVCKELELHRANTIEANNFLAKRINTAVQDIEKARCDFGHQVHSLATHNGTLRQISEEARNRSDYVAARLEKLERSQPKDGFIAAAGAQPNPTPKTAPAPLTAEEIETLKYAMNGITCPKTRAELEAIIARHK
jgi:hypothetical protein